LVSKKTLDTRIKMGPVKSFFLQKPQRGKEGIRKKGRKEKV